MRCVFPSSLHERGLVFLLVWPGSDFEAVRLGSIFEAIREGYEYTPTKNLGHEFICIFWDKWNPC